jgi:hypothetical protein
MSMGIRILKEPLLHFLVIGAVLFGTYAWFNRDGNETGTPQVRLGESDVRWLKETFALERQREPTQEELRSLVHDFLKEELFAREAQELGLDKDDITIRRRLALMITFLLQKNSTVEESSKDQFPNPVAAQERQREVEERHFVELLKKYRIVPDAEVKALIEPLLDHASQTTL